MLLSRRTLLGATAAAVPAMALGSNAFAKPRAADLTTAEGWLSWARNHRDSLALSIDDGRGERLEHRAHQPQPLASAIKVIPLAAYGEAVASGRLNPREHVRLGDWERFYVPLDGGGHVAALKALNVPIDATGLYAADPNHRVTIDQMADVMIRCSDSAVPDFLRHRLGLPALHEAATRNGWFSADVRSLCGEYLFLVFPEQAPPPEAGLAERQAFGFRLERMFSTDSRMRREMLQRLAEQVPPMDKQLAWASGTMAASATQLEHIHHSIATGNTRAGAVARKHLENPFREVLPPGAKAMGFKGGSLPGILTGGLSVRREDGSIATGSLLAHDVGSTEALGTGNPLLALRLAVEDKRWRDRLAQALRA